MPKLNKNIQQKNIKEKVLHALYPFNVDGDYIPQL